MVLWLTTPVITAQLSFRLISFKGHGLACGPLGVLLSASAPAFPLDGKLVHQYVALPGCETQVARSWNQRCLRRLIELSVTAGWVSHAGLFEADCGGEGPRE